jgi:hypothetical protein
MSSVSAIERACEEDLAFRVLAANQKPDHATLARFIERHEQALADLFGEVLSLCADAGLVKSGVVPVDGTKIAVNASREATMDYKRIATEIIEEAEVIDAEEDELYGEKRGHELPEQLTTTAGRKAWLREAKQRLDAGRAKQPRPVPRSRPKRLREAKRRLEQELRALPKTQSARRAHVRQHEVQPSSGSLPKTRQNRGTLGVAINHGNAQPAQAPPASDGDGGGLKPPPGFPNLKTRHQPAHRWPGDRRLAAFTRQPPTGAEARRLRVRLARKHERLARSEDAHVGIGGVRSDGALEPLWGPVVAEQQTVADRSRDECVMDRHGDPRP